jgi:hypothetical protein
MLILRRAKYIAPSAVINAAQSVPVNSVSLNPLKLTPERNSLEKAIIVPNMNTVSVTEGCFVFGSCKYPIYVLYSISSFYATIFYVLSLLGSWLRDMERISIVDRSHQEIASVSDHPRIESHACLLRV